MAVSIRVLSALLAVPLAAQTPPAAPKPAAAPATEAPKREDGLYVTIETSMGVIKGKLFEKEAPVTVRNFVDLALGRKVWTDPRTNLPVKKPLYSGLTFHRVIPNFMIQGGDPLGNGTGGTKAIRDEFHPDLKFDQPGRFAMANSGPNTGSCQFFITEVPTPHLNNLHTIFGQVTEGQEVVNAIARVPTKAENAPVKPVRMVKVSVERVGPAPVAPAKPAAKKKTVSKSGAVKAAPRAPAAAKPKTPTK
jgi:peptidyl-prolyl cis-trans isomerase A (cyclophilin A)